MSSTKVEETHPTSASIPSSIESSSLSSAQQGIPEPFSETPTALNTPQFPEHNLVNDEKQKQGSTDIAFAGTNAIDTLALDEQSPAPTNDPSNPDLSQVSKARKLALLTMFTLAEFLDSFNNSALFPAIPTITSQLHFELSETVWIISAYQLTFAAFLLVSGRVSDVYTPKPAFIAGAAILGITHLIGGFTHQKIAVLVLRALGGIGAALTIPSALSLIVQLFPEPKEQARAISIFGTAAAIGNVFGILIGALLVQYAGWAWIFWFVAIVGVSIAVICLLLIPNAKRNKELNVKFDLPGLGLLTSSVILFVFAVTSGSTKGWGTAYVLAPLFVSFAILAVFFVWEARIEPDDAVLPPRMWRYRNFGILVGLTLLPYFWWIAASVLLVPWYEEYYGWTAINTAVHFLPIGIGSYLISTVTGHLPNYFAHKYILLGGLALSIIATILLPFADAPSTYWPFVFPALTIGTIGMMIIYANSFIAIFYYTPSSVAGTVGAVFNCALQLGSAVGIAAISSITTSVDKKTSFDIPTTEWPHHRAEISKSMWKQAFKGRAASYWFLLGILGVLTIAVLVFFKVDPPNHEDHEQEKQKRDVEIPATH